MYKDVRGCRWEIIKEEDGNPYCYAVKKYDEHGNKVHKPIPKRIRRNSLREIE